MREKVKWIEEEAGLPDAYNRFIPLPASQPLQTLQTRPRSLETSVWRRKVKRCVVRRIEQQGNICSLPSCGIRPSGFNFLGRPGPADSIIVAFKQTPLPRSWHQGTRRNNNQDDPSFMPKSSKARQEAEGGRAGLIDCRMPRGNAGWTWTHSQRNGQRGSAYPSLPPSQSSTPDRAGNGVPFGEGTEQRTDGPQPRARGGTLIELGMEETLHRSEHHRDEKGRLNCAAVASFLSKGRVHDPVRLKLFRRTRRTNRTRAS